MSIKERLRQKQHEVIKADDGKVKNVVRKKLKQYVEKARRYRWKGNTLKEI